MQTLLLVLIVLLGVAGGMVVNYLADVYGVGEKLTRPFCTSCKDPFPLVTYFLWPRKCESCGARRSSRAWIVEAISVGLVLWIWLVPTNELPFLLSFLLVEYLIFVFVLDVEHKEVVISVVGFLIAAANGWVLHGWLSTLIGALVGAAVMFGFYLLGDVLARWLARRQGRELDEVALGLGDVFLSGVLGAALGWPGVVAGLVFAIILGGVISGFIILVMVIRKKYEAFTAIAYGPFILLSIFYLLYLKDLL